MDGFTNSLGQRFVPIPAGRFRMGSERGEFDERPAHEVIVSRPFAMAVTPVTNAQYEQFDPEHRRFRGQHGLSRDDHEAVIHVSWHEAVAFCAWLSAREGQPYRLPTEAEWEYAARAGTTTPYWTGPELPPVYHRQQEFDWFPTPVPLLVAQTPPNAWGLCDVHGLVEEWCHDGYGPYAPHEQTDPVGCDAEFKVTRGGSHNTLLPALRSANRAGTLPDDRHWLLGFRLVCGELPATVPVPPPPPARWAVAVSREPAVWPAVAAPLFAAPQRFVLIPPEADGPLYGRHNHQPAVTWCDNGDLLACWFSCRTERGREMTVVASRLRRGAESWEPADEFFKAPDRNMTGACLGRDGQGRLCHFNGLEAGDGWANLALVMRRSEDQGATWTTRLVAPEHQPRHQAIANLVRTRAGRLLLCCDAVYGGNGGTAVHLSDDDGETWRDPGAGQPSPRFAAGAKGAWIAGIHGAVAELADGSLLAFGRGDTIEGRMPCSRSVDGGERWSFGASPWAPIGGGQRLVLLRLRDAAGGEGPLLFCSFADASGQKDPVGLEVIDAVGQPRRIYGLFAALSYDEGQTWPVRKSLSPGAVTLDGGAWTGAFAADATHAEPRGYLACTQTPDGVIHLLSSALHYRFNQAWLEEPMAAE